MFKRLISTLLIVAITATLAIAGTVAYLTDNDKQVNTMTVGTVEIEQKEQDREGKDFVQDQSMLPIVKPTNIKDGLYPACDNYLDKIVTVTNTGSNDAYVRTLIAMPVYSYDGMPENDASANVIHWNGYSEGDKAPNYPAATRIPGTDKDVDNHWYWGQQEQGAWPGNASGWNTVEGVYVDDQEYIVYVVTHTTAIKPNEITAPNLLGVYLDSRVDYDNDNKNYTIDGKVINGFDGNPEIIVMSQAVQVSGFANVWEAMDTAYGEVTAANAAKWLGGTTN